MKKPLILAVLALLFVFAGVGLYAFMGAPKETTSRASLSQQDFSKHMEYRDDACKNTEFPTACEDGYAIGLTGSTDQRECAARNYETGSDEFVACAIGINRGNIAATNVPVSSLAECGGKIYTLNGSYGGELKKCVDGSRSTTTATSKPGGNKTTSSNTTQANKSVRDSNSNTVEGGTELGADAKAQKEYEKAQLAATSCSGDGVKVSDALGDADNCVGSNTTNPIYALINKIITYATGVFGLILVLMIVISGLQYVTAGGSPDKAKDARDRLESAATGLVLFVIMWGVLQLILPPDVSVFKS